ncbi:unnamed protein product [Rotaria socialis]|uniref:RING-type domain-containing protein n=1 Tax=Rotaria socialis TaxID=392032 RepID=A0A818WUQ9_9BILA|nr:unnamed protein product [Rotaria socialis]CAF4754707.1 unnamed protein product [Rotaria socialis]
MKIYAFCSSLLQRIHAQRLRDNHNKQMVYIREKLTIWFIYILVIFVSRCPNRVYNALEGPFPMNLNKFRNHLQFSYNLFGYQPFFTSRLFVFEPEYIQIELGRNAIDESIENRYRVFYDDYSHGKLLYTFNRVLEPTTDTPHMTLFIKFASSEQSYSQIRYPYHFESFTTNTWLEKSIYIETIEQIYNRNSTEFNRKVIIKCGILIGYLYRPTDKDVFQTYSNQLYQFNEHVRILDASSSYTPYISCVIFVICGLFVCLLLTGVGGLVECIISVIIPSPLILHPRIQEQMENSNIDSLDHLDRLLLNTTQDNNYKNYLFIVHDKYLAMFMMDLNEHHDAVFRNFNENIPFHIIPIEKISEVESDCIILNNDNYGRSLDFPTHKYDTDFKPAYWLHERFMVLNGEYRYHYEQEEEVHRRQEERQCLLELMIEEEVQKQESLYGNDINRILDGTRSVSPRFIAEFRLSHLDALNNDLPDATCRICLDDYKINRCSAQWPCQARHTFHFDCMLDVLRAGNMCPLCRHPVESTHQNTIQVSLQFLLERINPNIFN